MADSTHPLSSIHQPLPYYMAGEKAGVVNGVRPDLSGEVPSVRGGLDSAEGRRQLIEAGRQFEAYFVSYLLKVMRETVPQGAIANKLGAYFHSMYDQEIGTRAAESGGIGMSTMIQDYVRHQYSVPPGSPQVSEVKSR